MVVLFLVSWDNIYITDYKRIGMISCHYFCVVAGRFFSASLGG